MAARNRSSVTWVGRLVSVDVSHAKRTKPVVRVRLKPKTLGVGRGVGLVTSPSRKRLSDGWIDPRPKRGTGRLVRLHAVNYDRWRPAHSTAAWTHETPGAWAILRALPGGRFFDVYLIAPAEERCAMPGDFVCSKN